MVGHEPIQFVYGGVMNCTTTFPGKDFLPQLLPQFAHSFQGALSSG
jgi:hypothetical protein